MHWRAMIPVGPLLVVITIKFFTTAYGQQDDCPDCFEWSVTYIILLTHSMQHAYGDKAVPRRLCV